MQRTTSIAIALLGAGLLSSAGCLLDEPWDPPEGLLEDNAGIVGGLATADWPAIGAYLIDGGYGGMCTATLVHPDVLLTAAHCVDGAGSGDMFYVGSNIDNASWNDMHSIDDAIAQPGYDAYSYHPHDVAVLLLDEPIEDIDPIPVNTESMDSWAGRMLHYVGFGTNTQYNGQGAGTKRETDIQIYEVYSHEYLHYTPGTNTCSGDSGGPGLVELDGRWYVAGVNSSVGAVDEGQDPCSGYGFEMRVDEELNFLDDYFDPNEDPAGDDDDDDDDLADDDDTPPMSELPAPYVDEDTYDRPEGCACSHARASHSRVAAGAWLSAILALTLLRRRR